MLTGRSSALVKYITKVIRLIAKQHSCKSLTKSAISSTFDIGLNATYAKLSGKWNEVPKWSGVTVSQLI